MKKLLPPQLFLIFILLMGLICWGLGLKHYILFPYNLLGILFLISGIYLAQSSKNLFLKKETNVNTFDKPNKFITEGFYKYSRNPMYLGFVIALLGISILYQGSISSILGLILFIVIVDRWYIKFEENLMFDKFGDDYVKYCKKTKKWI